MKMTLPKEWYESKLPHEEGYEIGAGCPAVPLFGLLALTVMGANEPPVSLETHGPGICGYCGKRNAVLKTEPRSQKSYCRKCAPGRETDADWPNAKDQPTEPAI